MGAASVCGPAAARNHSLCALALGPRHAGLAREDLLQAIWTGTEIELAVQALHTQVYSLRRALGDALGGQGRSSVRTADIG